MPRCFSDCMPSGPYQCRSGGYSAAGLSAFSQYETASSRSESRVSGKPVYNHATASERHWGDELCTVYRCGGSAA
jgi:hypothetical protein